MKEITTIDANNLMADYSAFFTNKLLRASREKDMETFNEISIAQKWINKFFRDLTEDETEDEDL